MTDSYSVIFYFIRQFLKNKKFINEKINEFNKCFSKLFSKIAQAAYSSGTKKQMKCTKLRQSHLSK